MGSTYMAFSDPTDGCSDGLSNSLDNNLDWQTESQKRPHCFVRSFLVGASATYNSKL